MGLVLALPTRVRMGLSVKPVRGNLLMSAKLRACERASYLSMDVEALFQ